MCGIYGMFDREGHGGVAQDDRGRVMAAMDAALRHRGPDDSGTLLDGACAIGMRRLSIIDVGGGRQPIASEDRGVWVVFNGEIYNHRSLRRSLSDAGHRFATASDTEVIVHLYEDHGLSFVEKLRGMFAIALWDRRRQRLVLARDRLGIKPLYYANTARGFFFASEVRALVATGAFPREMDLGALSHYLSLGTTPPGSSMVRGVAKLPPAHLLVVERGRIEEPRRYWDLRPPCAPSRITQPEAEEQVRSLIVDAVRSHLESDVPVGAFLSGGIDSSTVVAVMAREGLRPHTFSIGFDESDFDELAWARRIADRFGTHHDEYVVRPDIWSLVSEIATSLDEPLADVSAIPTWLVSQRAARRVKVVLSGDGGDEVFGGYERYGAELSEARRYDRLPGFVTGAMARIADALPDSARGKRWLRHAALPPGLRYVDEHSLFPADLKAQLLTPELSASFAALPSPVDKSVAMLTGAPGDALGRLLYYETMTYLPLDILTKVDRMSMAHSLEVRPPLLDTPLVEAVAAWPSAWKVSPQGEHKQLLRRAVRPWLPAEIIERKKRGFGVPIRAWFRGPLRKVVREVLCDRRFVERGLYSAAKVRALLDEHDSERRDHSMRLWALLVLELWTRDVLEGAVRPSRAAEVQNG